VCFSTVVSSTDLLLLTILQHCYTLLSSLFPHQTIKTGQNIALNGGRDARRKSRIYNYSEAIKSKVNAEFRDQVLSSFAQGEEFANTCNNKQHVHSKQNNNPFFASKQAKEKQQCNSITGSW
jgi:hypothetical protein